MEPIETFMEIFTRSCKEKNSDALVRILKDANVYFRNVSKSNGERALEILLHKETGLLKFIQNMLQNYDAAKYAVPLKESFSVLQIIIQSFNENYEPYIMHTRDMCLLCMKTICWFYARKAAAEALKKLIELNPNYDMKLHKVIDHYNSSYLKLYSKKDGSIFYIVIGTIAKHCPKTLLLEDCIDSIYLQLFKDLKSQFKPGSSKQPEEIKIYVESLFDMFENFVPLEANPKKKEYFQQLYHYISLLCEPNNAQKVLRTKVFYFLSTYIKHFSTFVFKDYEKWHVLLNKFLEETDAWHGYTILGALRAFYNIIALHLLEENREDIFLYFKNYLTLNLCDRSLPKHKSRLIVYGLGELSVTFEKYSPEEIRELFQMVALQTVRFYEREEEVDQDCEAIADYLQTLSKILIHTPKVLLQQVNIIVELSIFLTKNFPTYKDSNKVFVERILKATFVNITQLDKNLQNEYFNSFFREGILWSCSHESFIDEGLQQDDQLSEDNSVRYKNYLPLWHSIFKITDDDKTYRYSILQIFDEFVHILTSFIDKLNLNVKICEIDSLADTFFPLEAENEADFQFFINLVYLYIDIFERIESFIFENWMEKLLLYFIRYSYKHPLIPGFYKLIQVILKKIDNDSLKISPENDDIPASSEHEMTFNKSTCELIGQYFSDILGRVNGFTDDLQLSCIHLIFNVPPVFVLDLIDQTVPVFKIAFTIGLGDISLAFFALDTLENWIRSSPKPFSNEFFKSVIIYLEPYISNEDSSVQQFQGIKKLKKRDMKTAIITDDQHSLENLQKRILLFYGSLDTSILFDIVHEKALHTDATWSKKDLLQCELFFPDIRLEINFDKFIPRILDITKSGDEKTRLAACEFLHAMVTVILGKRLALQCLNRDVFEALLRIGSDANDSIRNLYQPLIIQISHYLNSRQMKESKLPSEFLDALFEGLTAEFNPLLRDYCGLYLKEFTQWSIKQSSEIQSSNVENIIRRITDWALYPSNSKRIAAAIAFNNLYTILRDNTQVVNKYWLELFYILVKCMKDCDDIEVMSAVNHAEKVMKFKSNLFNAKSAERRKPLEFTDANLKSVLVWLFHQSLASSSKCRAKCMELFENLLPQASDRESLKEIIAKDVNHIVLSTLRTGQREFGADELNDLLRSLEFYLWILKKKIVPFNPETITCSYNQKTNAFVELFSNFVWTVNQGSLSVPDNATSETTLKIIEFLSILFLESESDAWSYYFSNDNLFILLTNCILHPRQLGLATKRLQIMEKLPEQLGTLLKLMMERLPREQHEQLREYLRSKVEESIHEFAEIRNIVAEKSDVDKLEEFLKGLLILKRCKFFDFSAELNITLTYVRDKMNDIFGACKIKILDTDSCKKFTDVVKEYLELLMHFFLEDFEPETMQGLIQLIMTEDLLVRPNGAYISHGQYFLEIFKAPIFQCISKNAEDAFKLLDDFLPTHPGKILLLIEELLIHTQRNKTSECEILSQVVIDRCAQIQRYLNDIEERKARFFNINRIAVTLKKKPIKATKTNGQTNEFYNWILEELVRAKDLERKSAILRSFLICLTDEESKETSRELALIFRQLRDEDSASCLRKFESNEIEKFQAAACFQVLLKMMVATRSLVVYQAVIRFAAGVYKFLYKENVSEFLSLYFGRVSDDNAFESLILAYKVFMDLTLSTERLDVLKYFLLPSIEFCNASMIKKFYETNCQEMAFFVTQTIDVNISVDRRKAIVTKIGCYSIFEMIFAKFELNFINVTDPVSKTEKPVNQVLVQHSLEVRKLSASSDEEKEIMRLLHCAALNCCISVISLKGEDKFYRYIFLEDRSKGQLIWEKIVDCDKKYNLMDNTTFIRRDRKKLINIRRKVSDDDDAEEDIRRFTQPMTLTLLEDIHAYDLNDTRILSDSGKAVNQEPERRLGLSLTNDELNDHECMPMLSGVLMELLKNAGELTELPMSLKVFRNGFATRNDNCKLFLMKLVTNLKDAFIKYIKPMFTAIVSTICSYLDNNELNYIVRDAIVFLVESKCKLTEASEKKAAQRMLEQLIERAADLQESVYKYNLELLETLCKLWKDDGLTCPIGKLETKAQSNPELIVRVSLVLLRCEVSNGIELANSKVVRETVKTLLDQGWQDDESKVIRRFELLGYILRLDQCNEVEACIGWLSKLLVKIDTRNRERCRRCVYALYKGSRGVNLGELQVSRFTGDATRIADSHKPDCLELFILRMHELDSEVSLPAELPRLGLKAILRERVLGCEGAALTIVERLVPLLSKEDISSFIELVAKNYTSSRCTQLEHRRKAYKILAETYLRHGLTNKNAPMSKLCIKHLVQGLSDDPAEEIREELLSFWTSSRFGLPSSCPDRLLALLELYEPELASSFPRFFCLLMLKLTSESLDNDRPMFRSLTEDDSNFKESNTLGSSIFSLSRRRRLLLLGPSQVNRSSQSLTSSQTGTRLSTVVSWGATIQPMSRREKMSKELGSGISAVPKYRPSYKFGDYPDVELKHVDFVESLRQLIVNDWLSCRHLAVAMICSLVLRSRSNPERYTNFLTKLTSTFEKMLTLEGESQIRKPDEGSHFAAVMLEVMIQAQELRMNVDSAAKISRSAGLASLGVLLVEQDIVDSEHKERNEEEPPLAKRRRVDLESSENQCWMQLVELYKSIGEKDVVKCIVNCKRLYSEEFRRAIMYEALNDWASAKKAYAEAYETCNEVEKEHCFEAELECLAQLASWSEINEKTSSALGGNYDAVWKSPRREQLLPWILEGQLNKALEDLTGNKELENQAFIDRFFDWLRAAGDDLSRISPLFHQELISVLLLCSKQESTARHYLKSSLEHLRDQWVRSSPLMKNLKTNVLTRLRGIFNIHAYTETIRASDMEEATRGLLKYWDQRAPAVGQDLYSWNVHVLHRLTFAHLLHEKLTSMGEEESESSWSQELLVAGIKQRQAISDMAIGEKNKTLAKKHVSRIEGTLSAIEDFPELNSKFVLTASKYKFVCAEKEERTSKKCNYYLGSWQIACDLLENEDLDKSIEIQTKYHLFELTREVKNLALSNRDFVGLLMSNDFVSSKLDFQDDKELFTNLAGYSFSVLKDSCGIGKDNEMAESYTKFGKYCYDLLQELLVIDNTLVREFISAILSGMSYDSLASAHYFPCLLKPEYYENNEEAVEVFTSKCENIPSWLFLPWQAQIISRLTGPLSCLLLPVFRRLLNDYPNAVMYNFQTNYVYLEAAEELKNNPEIRRMYEKLFADSKIKRFLGAMHRLCQPEYYMRYHLLRFINNEVSVDSLLDTIFGDNSSTGDYFKVKLEEYRDELEKLKSMVDQDETDIEKYAAELSSSLYNAMKRRLSEYKKQGLQIKDYSRYLDNFSGEDFEIEVPGQYQTENRKPMPRYHAKFSKFHKSVVIMESKSNPMKISMIGNDARTYSFLVKFGEDLRQDQWLQQIFRITNKTLESDKDCRKRYLKVNTYNVVPLSSSLGLIEWVNDTKSLKEFVEFPMTDKTRIQTVSAKYNSWIEKAGKSGQEIHQTYREALTKYSCKEVTAKMRELIEQIECDCMRRTFVTLSTSAECFLSLRRNFMSSYATMCIVHWITGVGDRHLENLLIQVKTGKCYGIDFESAFGLGIDQSVPELVPFRLTAQILGLFKPFDEQGIFADTMVHVLSALRNEKGPTLACLDTFIHESLSGPVIGQSRRKRSKSTFDADKTKGIRWLPKRKMEIVAKKLNGMKPSTIMIEELSNMHGGDDGEDSNTFIKYKIVVSGNSNDLPTVRYRMKNELLTPEEQVQCLLEQAKDLNCLGRMYVGWCPFV